MIKEHTVSKTGPIRNQNRKSRLSWNQPEQIFKQVDTDKTEVLSYQISIKKMRNSITQDSGISKHLQTRL